MSAEEYRVVRCTAALREAIERLLSAGAQCDSQLREELQNWLQQDTSSIVFPLVCRIHKQLKALGSEQLYLHELLEGSELQLPAVQPPPRSAELEARLNAIRARQENKEYNKMVDNVDPMISKQTIYQFGLEVQSTSRQLWTVVNFFITVIGAFTFGYFAAHFAGLDVPQAVFVGLGLAILVFIADLYFLVRTPSIVSKKEH